MIMNRLLLLIKVLNFKSNSFLLFHPNRSLYLCINLNRKYKMYFCSQLVSLINNYFLFIIWIQFEAIPNIISDILLSILFWIKKEYFALIDHFDSIDLNISPRNCSNIISILVSSIWFLFYIILSLV